MSGFHLLECIHYPPCCLIGCGLQFAELFVSYDFGAASDCVMTKTTNQLQFEVLWPRLKVGSNVVMFIARDRKLFHFARNGWSRSQTLSIAYGEGVW